MIAGRRAGAPLVVWALLPVDLWCACRRVRAACAPKRSVLTLPFDTPNSNQPADLTLCSSANAGGLLHFPNDIAFRQGKAIITSACGQKENLFGVEEGAGEGGRAARAARGRAGDAPLLFLMLQPTHISRCSGALSTLLSLPLAHTHTLSLSLSLSLFVSHTHT